MTTQVVYRLSTLFAISIVIASRILVDDMVAVRTYRNIIMYIVTDPDMLVINY